MRLFLIAITLCSLYSCASSPKRKTTTSGESVSAALTRTQSELLKKARASYAKGEITKASDLADKIIEVHLKTTERTDWWNLKGLLRLAEKKPADAVINFHQAIEANTRNEFAGYYEYNLASALNDSGHADEALARLNTIRVETMDPLDQKKVASLKDRILKAKANPNGTIAQNPLAVGSGTPLPPTEHFNGPVKAYRIGLLLPLSGKYETFGKKAQKAIELALQTSNDSRSKSYELVPIDSGESVETHKEALKKLVEEEQVIAVIGPLLSKPLEALTERAAFYQIPLISIAQGQGATSQEIFSCSVSAKDQAAKIVDYAMNTRGFHRFAILAPSNKSGSEMANLFWDQIESRHGEVRAFELYNPDITDFREPVDKTLGTFYTETRQVELDALAKTRDEMKITRKTMKTLKYFELPPIIDFDAVFIADEAKTVGQIIPTFTYRDAKNLPYLGISSWNSPQLISRAQDQVEGAVFPVGFNTLNPPEETRQFFDLYTNTYGSNPGELDAVAFDSTVLAIKTMGSQPSTRAEFIQKLETVGSVLGATGMINIQGHYCARNLPLYTVKKGQFEMVQGN